MFHLVLFGVVLSSVCRTPNVYRPNITANVRVLFELKKCTRYFYCYMHLLYVATILCIVYLLY